MASSASVLPDTWQTCTLGEIAEKPQYGLTATASDEKVGPQFLRITDIQDYGVRWDTVPFCKCTSDEKEKCRLRRGDVVIARIGATTGKAYLISEPPDAVFASYLIRVRTQETRLLPEFFYYFTLSGDYWEQIDASKGGRLKQGVNIPNLQALSLPLPPLEEQRAIAGVLRTVLRAKETTGKVIAAARQLKQSLMRHLFTYGPVPVQEADQVELQETDFGESPRHWASELLDDCCAVQTGAAKGRRFGDDETVELPYLRVANVQGGYLDLKEMKTITIRKREIDRYSLQDGDVVLTEGGDFDKLGRGFIWRNEIPGCLHQNHVFAVRADRTKLLPEFVAHQTQSDYGRAYFLSVAHRTTNLACINTTKLKAFPMLIPPLSEQREIEANLDAVDKKLAQEEEKRSALASLFDSLLHELMTGIRRVNGGQMSFDTEKIDG